ncbi:MAG: alkene reductase [Bacteroidia bacterium]|nr:MAG: alkene reductase [Bacteroidia bacterium]
MEQPTHPLFQQYRLGDQLLNNRIVMAPLTRRRADAGSLAANDLMASYYRQRSSAGLIIAEGSQISPEGYGLTCSPGCYTPEQVAGWQKVTHAVHESGGRIFLQLWHVGPWSHPSLQPEGKAPLAASKVKPDRPDILTYEGRKPFEYARPMTVEEIRHTVKDFGQAAQNAMKAGFDGVEIHGAHSYLIDQFIMDGTNKRTDQYGGPVQNRARFLFEVIDEILGYLPSSKVGLRLSPRSVKKGMEDAQPEKTYGWIIERLNDYALAYLHISEMMSPEERLHGTVKSVVPYYRNIFHGTMISCGGHSPASARMMTEAGHADLIAFGKPFIANPDLVARLKVNAPLAEPDKETFYLGGAKGYTDYPTMQQTSSG